SGPVGQHREILRGGDGRPDRPGLCTDARRHRCHLGTRPAPVPSPGYVVPRHVWDARGTQSAGVRVRKNGSLGQMTQDESVAEFAERARAWLADNMPAIDRESPPPAPRDDEQAWLRARELQKRLYDGGFAGICFPREYGGLGLDYEYQQAFDAESLDYEMPLILNNPTFTICCATLL